MDIHIIKVGGENASDPRTAAWISDFRNQGNTIVVAISALRTKPLNTTTELLRAKEVYKKNGIDATFPILEELFRVHIDTLKQAGMYDAFLEHILEKLFHETFPRDLPDFGIQNRDETGLEQRFVGYGELMSAHVLKYLLEKKHTTQAFLFHDHIQSQKDSLEEILCDTLGTKVYENLQSGIIIVPGYVPVKGHQYLPVFGRGYTDKMAERLAVGLADRGCHCTLHIQKQVPILSSNPKINPNARPIEELSYWSSAEITGAHGANAQVLNEHTITPSLTRNAIHILVYNPFRSDTRQTHISEKGSSQSGILFVDGRENVISITIAGFSMSGSGFLADLAEIFKENSIAIEDISSSETEVTFIAYGEVSDTNCQILQDTIAKKIGSDYTIEINNTLGLIYCIGDNLKDHPGILASIGKALAQEHIDIICVTQSYGQRAVTIGVSSKNLWHGVKVIHQELIEKSPQ